MSRHRTSGSASFATVTLAIVVLIVPSGTLAVDPPPQGPVLSLAGIGLECWEDGRAVATQRERWDHLSCERRGYEVSCDLYATMIKGCLLGKPLVAVGTPPVRVRRFDRRRGRLDLTVMYGDEPAECTLEFVGRPDRDDANGTGTSSADKIRSLRCTLTHRNFDGSVTVLETRLPEKSYEWRPPCGYWLMGADNRVPGE